LTERNNEAWLRDLDLPSPQCDAAIEELRQRLLKGLNAAFAHYHNVSRHDLEDFAQDAVSKIIKQKRSFRGECRFTTWATKVAVNLTITELRRRRWKDVSLDELTMPGVGDSTKIMSSGSASPEKQVIRKSMLELVTRAIREQLTDRQRKAMMAIMFQKVPIGEMARRMGSNRNSMYKLLHDARKRLKAFLIEQGISMDEVLEAFD
jgi:RNA polymerase sigma-70 factor (ECF subfamily)